MSDIHIPTSALEAGARAIAESLRTARLTTEAQDGYKPEACAAFLAMLQAWPRMEHDGPSGGGVSQEPLQLSRIILPLPQEARDER